MANFGSFMTSFFQVASNGTKDGEQVAPGDGGDLVVWLGMVFRMVGIDRAAPELGVRQERIHQ